MNVLPTLHKTQIKVKDTFFFKVAEHLKIGTQHIMQIYFGIITST